MGEIKVIGTSHIAEESIREVNSEIENWQPDIVALELDVRRLHSLMHKQKSKITFQTVRRIGAKGFVFFLIASFVQKKLGKLVGVSPGSDMKEAYLTAKKKKLKVALIDRQIEITLNRLSKSIGWRERFRFVGDLIKGVFKKDIELLVLAEDLNLRKVPSKELIRKVMGILKKRYPSVHRVLVEERNYVMAANLIAIQKMEPDKKILAIVGAGHEEEIMRLISKGFKNIQSK